MLAVLTAASVLAATPGLSCALRNGVIDVRLPAPQAGELRRSRFGIAATSARGSWRDFAFVVDDNVRLSPYRWDARQLRIDVRRQDAARYQDGRRLVAPAFPRPGLYTLVFSDILETERENMASIECTVRIPALTGRRVQAR